MLILPDFDLKSADSERDSVQVISGFDGPSGEESQAPKRSLRDLTIAEIAIQFYMAALEALGRSPW